MLHTLSDKVHHFFDTCKNNHNQCHISEITSSQQQHMYEINSLTFRLKNLKAAIVSFACLFFHTAVFRNSNTSSCRVLTIMKNFFSFWFTLSSNGSTAVPKELNQFSFYSNYTVPTQKKIQSRIMTTGYGWIRQVITEISERLHETFWYCFSSMFVRTPLESSTL